MNTMTRPNFSKADWRIMVKDATGRQVMFARAARFMEARAVWRNYDLNPGERITLEYNEGTGNGWIEACQRSMLNLKPRCIR